MVCCQQIPGNYSRSHCSKNDKDGCGKSFFVIIILRYSPSVIHTHEFVFKSRQVGSTCTEYRHSNNNIWFFNSLKYFLCFLNLYILCYFILSIDYFY